MIRWWRRLWCKHEETDDVCQEYGTGRGTVTSAVCRACGYVKERP